MQEPSSDVTRFFRQQLNAIHSELRCIWGEKDYGVDRWVVQRKLPPEVHAHCLEEFHQLFPGEERFIDQQLVNDNGVVVSVRRCDRVAEWVLVHIVEDRTFEIDDPRGYRPPDQRDIATIWNWLHEFRDITEQMKAMKEEEAARDQKHQQERVRCLAEDIRDSRAIFEDPPIFDMGQNRTKESESIPS